MENKWLERGVVIKSLYPADENKVVSAWVNGFVAALEPGGTALEERGTGKPAACIDALKAIRQARSKAIGDGLLVGGENVDRIVAGLTEHFNAGRCYGQTPQDERWVEGDRIEGTDGHAATASVGIERGEYGHSGGKTAQGPTKILAAQALSGQCAAALAVKAGRGEQALFRAFLRGGS